MDWVGRCAEGKLSYKSEERPVDSAWARWIRADVRDGQTERCVVMDARQTPTKRRKRTRLAEPPGSRAKEYNSESGNEGEYVFLARDQLVCAEVRVIGRTHHEPARCAGWSGPFGGGGTHGVRHTDCANVTVTDG